MKNLIRLVLALALTMTGLLALSTTSQADEARDFAKTAFKVRPDSQDGWINYQCSAKDKARSYKAYAGGASTLVNCDPGNFLNVELVSYTLIRCKNTRTNVTWSYDNKRSSVVPLVIQFNGGNNPSGVDWRCSSQFDGGSALREQAHKQALQKRSGLTVHTTASKPKPITVPPLGGIGIPGSPWHPLTA